MRKYPSIKYREGYEFQLAEDYEVDTGMTFAMVDGVWHARFHDLDVALPWIKFDLTLPPPFVIGDRFFRLTLDGHIFIREDYAWDGPSRPAIKTKNFMRGSLEHDMLYQAMREGILPPEFRIIADARLKRVVQQDGMWCGRAGWVYGGVREFAGGAIDPRPDEIIVAP